MEYTSDHNYCPICGKKIKILYEERKSLSPEEKALVAIKSMRNITGIPGDKEYYAELNQRLKVIFDVEEKEFTILRILALPFFSMIIALHFCKLFFNYVIGFLKHGGETIIYRGGKKKIADIYRDLLLENKTWKIN